MTTNKILNRGDIQKHLQQTRENLMQSLQAKTEDRAAILHKRAALLARELPKKITTAEYLTVIEFTLHNENYGLDIRQIKKVHPLQHLTPLPCTPPHIAGMINIHGSIVPVVDLKTFFNLPTAKIEEFNKVIILETEDTKLGILADEIIGVLSIPMNEIQTEMSAFANTYADLIFGVTEGRLLILNVLNLLKDNRIIVNDLM